jgi:hypothetical protein
MSKDRYNFLMENWDEKLTPEEFAAGWHWCLEWDGMLVGTDSIEALVCSCNHPAIEAWKASEDGKKLQKELDDHSEAMCNPVIPDDPLEYFEKLRQTPEYKERQEAMDRLAALDEELGLNEPNRKDHPSGAD